MFTVFHILRTVCDWNIAAGVFVGVFLGVFLQEGDEDRVAGGAGGECINCKGL